MVLGSGSPRRREILSSFFDDITVMPPHVDESVLPGEKPRQYVERIVSQKMDSVISLKSPDDNRPAVTADTIVTVDDSILGKPESLDDAVDMLLRLSGREHRVMTGLCMTLGGSRKITGVEQSRVYFKKILEPQVRAYLAAVEYRDKAGSYAIQDHGDMIVHHFEGSLSNIIGFPLRLFFSMLSSAGALSLLYSGDIS